MKNTVGPAKAGVGRGWAAHGSGRSVHWLNLFVAQEPSSTSRHTLLVCVCQVLFVLVPSTKWRHLVYQQPRAVHIDRGYGVTYNGHVCYICRCCHAQWDQESQCPDDKDEVKGRDDKKHAEDFQSSLRFIANKFKKCRADDKNSAGSKKDQESRT